MAISSRRARGLACICSLFLGAAAIDAGCSSDSFTSAASTDAGSETGTVSDSGALLPDSGGDAGAPCISPPASIPPSDVAFCDAFAMISSRCNSCANCQIENAASCATFGDQLSDAFKAGIAACENEIDCADFENQGALAQDPCVAAYVFDAGPTSAQIEAKNQYCAHCSDAGNGGEYCTGFFGSPDAGGIGSVVLFSSDKVAIAVTSGCTSCDLITYPLCTGGKLCDGVPKDQCGKGLCK